MKILLSSEELEMLAREGVTIDPDSDYSEDQVFEILDSVYDIEVMYAQATKTDANARALANQYAAIADKIQNAIPEE